MHLDKQIEIQELCMVQQWNALGNAILFHCIHMIIWIT